MISVKTVDSGSLGSRAGFRTGDGILSINGEKIRDLIDFQVHSAEPHLIFEVERDREIYVVEVDRVHGENIGIAFEEMHLRRCNNKCVFCFLHQMPPGLRRSLYFEDDDYRLSFLHGSYVTLTNMKDSDIRRIIDQGLSPQYISVHSTDPDLRQRLLGRKKPTVPILDRIQLLADHNIEMHGQIVVCPGLNDGPHLERTVHDLNAFYPAVRSVAVVPVGLTRFRSHLPSLQPVTPVLAVEYLKAAEIMGYEFVKKLGERFVYPADELFLLGGRQLPQTGYYDTFPQIENGIGMVRAFQDRWEAGKATLSISERPLRLAVVTGVLAASFLEPIVCELNTLTELDAQLIVIENNFFGRGITVSGLLTAGDITQRLKAQDYDLCVLPPNCINGDGRSIDDLTVNELQDACGIPLTVGTYDFPQTVRTILKFWDEGQEFVRTEGEGRQLSELGFFVGSRMGSGE